MTATPDRPGLDQLTSDQLDRLYADLDRYDEVQGEMNENAINLTRALARAEATLTASESKRQALMRAHVALAGQAGRDQAAVRGVRAFHERDPDADYCVVCSDHGDITWPCATVAVLDQHGQTPKETT